MTIVLMVLLGVFAAEAYSLYWVGAQIGLVASLALTVLTGIAGLAVVRAQGLKVAALAQNEVAAGRMPVAPVIHGIGLLAAGMFLFFPGFITDAIGALLLIPPVRLAIGRWALARLQGSMTIVRTAAAGGHRAQGILDLDADMWQEADSGDPRSGRSGLRDPGLHGSQPPRPPNQT